MRVLRVRVILLLSVLYLCCIFLLYSYLWKRNSLDIDKLFDTPGENSISYSDNEFVQFNFKRRNRLLNPASNNSQQRQDEDNDELGAAAMAAEESPVSREFGGSFKDSEVLAANKNQELRIDHEKQSLSIGKPPSNVTTKVVQTKPSKAITHSRNAGTPHTLYNISDLPPPNYCIHAFYYAWYGNEKVDGTYLHWNHKYIPHWQKNIADQYPQGRRHNPPDDIGANFYPRLGCYSSKDVHIIEAHMFELRQAGVGVIAVSWFPPGLADAEGTPPDYILPLLLDAADMYSIKVTIHIEPYEKRSALSVREDLKYIHEQYFSHPAFYKHHTVNSNGEARMLPLIYFYDSYLINPGEWQQVLEADSDNSIRGTPYDCIAISLLVSTKEKRLVLEGGFDGFYTYFASNGFSYGSSTKNWKDLTSFAESNDLFFIPSFGPGYEDTRVRPWNKRNSKEREFGRYYQIMFTSALSNNRGGVISLTSYNEWHEGTQIEGAIPKTIDGYSYSDYSPNAPDFYLQLTHKFSQRLQCSLQ